ncbi:MAG: glycosyltransferase family 2 protein [Paludibacteraceae bacterium]|jgi:glycosyltransferase involved in cell wall biosynthesis|nr:glycosyltransferase family 2 protein [Paludibacteraceae bacterium]
MNISVIVPLFNEAESLVELYDWIARVMRDNKFSYEVIFVDDGSTDNSWQVIQELKSKIDNPKSKNDDAVRGIRFRRNYGKSAALYCGFKAAQGDVVITMDADLQDSPDEIPELYRMITEEGYDLVSGWKKKRYDNALTKNLPSKLFNATARWVTGIHLHDMNCGLKAYRNEVVKNIEVFSEMHRYIPFLAKNAGFTKIGEKVVQHRKREHGVSKFGLNRFVNGYLDLMTLWFLNKFGKQPMHFFGLVGSMMFLIGFIAVVVVGGMKWYALAHQVQAMLVGVNPYFHIAILMMILGCMLFLAGFLGELIIRNSPSRNDYLIREQLL